MRVVGTSVNGDVGQGSWAEGPATVLHDSMTLVQYYIQGSHEFHWQMRSGMGLRNFTMRGL